MHVQRRSERQTWTERPVGFLVELAFLIVFTLLPYASAKHKYTSQQADQAVAGVY